MREKFSIQTESRYGSLCVCVSVARWPRGLGDGHWPQVWDLPTNPTTWTTRDQVPYAPNIHRLPHGKKVHIG